MNEAERFSTVACVLSRQEGANELVPGLPNCIVLDCVLPWIPWYARAVLAVTSKAWKQALHEPCTYSELSRRVRSMKSSKGMVMVHQLSEQATLECYMNVNTRRRMPRPHAISVLEEDDTRMIAQQDTASQRPIDHTWSWRKLPPIPAFAPLRILQDCGVVCLDGKIFVIGGWDPRTDAVHAGVYMLDIAAGLWEWEAMAPMHFARAFFHCIAMANKIYVVGGTSSPCIEDPGPEVFDVDTHTWAILPRVSMSRSFHFNGLSLIKGGNLVLAHGFCTTERGELVSFRRMYDPVVGMWSDYECVDDDVKDNTTSKIDDGRSVTRQCDDVRNLIGGTYAITQRSSGVIMNVMML